MCVRCGAWPAPISEDGARWCEKCFPRRNMDAEELG
jgi:hypothetical protein